MPFNYYDIDSHRVNFFIHFNQQSIKDIFFLNNFKVQNEAFQSLRVKLPQRQQSYAVFCIIYIF